MIVLGKSGVSHRWEICGLCGPTLVCGVCGNATCTAGTGRSSGRKLCDCEEAYAIYEEELARCSTPYLRSTLADRIREYPPRAGHCQIESKEELLLRQIFGE